MSTVSSGSPLDRGNIQCHLRVPLHVRHFRARNGKHGKTLGPQYLGSPNPGPSPCIIITLYSQTIIGYALPTTVPARGALHQIQHVRRRLKGNHSRQPDPVLSSNPLAQIVDITAQAPQNPPLGSPKMTAPEDVPLIYKYPPREELHRLRGRNRQ